MVTGPLLWLDAAALMVTGGLVFGVRWPWLGEALIHVAKPCLPPTWTSHGGRKRGSLWASPQRSARSDALTTAPAGHVLLAEGGSIHLSSLAFHPAQLLKQLKTQVSSEVGQWTILQPVISKDSKYKSSSQNEIEMKHDKMEQVSEKVLKSSGLFIVKPAKEAKRIKHPEVRY